MNLADGETVCLLHSPNTIRQRNKIYFDPTFYKWGEPMTIPAFWGLEKTVAAIAKDRRKLWHRYTWTDYSTWNWFATIVATDNREIVRVEYKLENLSQLEKDFLGVSAKHHFLRLPENIQTFLS